MKNVKLIALLLAVVVLAFSSCKKDEEEPKGTAVEISSVTLSPDNSVLTVTFNQPVYRNADMTGNIDATCFELTFTATKPVTASYVTSHTAGDSKVIITITYETRLAGDEALDVTVKANTVYNAEGGPVSQDLTETVNVNELGIIGNWSAYDISFILQSLLYDDSLYANFYGDNSYIVTAYQDGSPQIFEGTYQMNKSNNDDIWEIQLNQSQPYTVLSEGIFKIFAASPDSMWYEVAQVDPAILGVTPPTADAGFGSTSGGALGTGNVQKYTWIGQGE